MGSNHLCTYFYTWLKIVFLDCMIDWFTFLIIYLHLMHVFVIILHDCFYRTIWQFTSSTPCLCIGRPLGDGHQSRSIITIGCVSVWTNLVFSVFLRLRQQNAAFYLLLLFLLLLPFLLSLLCLISPLCYHFFLVCLFFNIITLALNKNSGFWTFLKTT